MRAYGRGAVIHSDGAVSEAYGGLDDEFKRHRRVDNRSVFVVDQARTVENAGRTLAWHVRDTGAEKAIVVAGNGRRTRLCPTRGESRRPSPGRLGSTPDELDGAAAQQHRILAAMAVPTSTDAESLSRLDDETAVVDAFVGYGLHGEVRPRASRRIDGTNDSQGPIVSLDVPSGIDATTGDAQGCSKAGPDGHARPLENRPRGGHRDDIPRDISITGIHVLVDALTRLGVA